MWGSKKFTLLVSISLSAVFLSACTPAEPFEVPNFDQGTFQNIVNGIEVQSGNEMANSVVLVINRATSEVCTASLLDSNHALTAAHCLDNDNPGNLYVFFAAKPNSSTERRQVIAARASSYWAIRQKEDANTGDIAVIKFAGTQLPRGYKPVEILEDPTVLRVGKTIPVLGYGFNDPNDPASAGVLRMTQLKVLNMKFSSTEIVLDQSKGSGVCHGDSGGPAYVYVPGKSGKKGRYLLWGVTSRSINDGEDSCARSVAITNAVLYKTWIQNVLRTL